MKGKTLPVPVPVPVPQLLRQLLFRVFSLLFDTMEERDKEKKEEKVYACENTPFLLRGLEKIGEHGGAKEFLSSLASTSLFFAVKNGFKEAVGELLCAGVDVNCRESHPYGAVCIFFFLFFFLFFFFSFFFWIFVMIFVVNFLF